MNGMTTHHTKLEFYITYFEGSTIKLMSLDFKALLSF